MPGVVLKRLVTWFLIFFLLLDFCDDGFFPLDDDFVGLLLAAFLSMMPARFVRLSYRVQLIRNVPNVDIYIFWTV